VAGAGVGLSCPDPRAAALNLGGIECLVGIPPTIGGSVAMNAARPIRVDNGDFISPSTSSSRRDRLGEFKPGRQLLYRDFAAPAGAVVVGRGSS